MEFEQLLSRLAVALGIGLLIGLERGWRRRAAGTGARAAGIRTFAISGLLGGIVGAIGQVIGTPAIGGALVVSVGLVVYAAVMTLFSRDENRAHGEVSATNAIASILTFSLGALAVLVDVRLAAAAAVAAAAILAIRAELHDWLKALTWPELRSTLVLLAMSFIALPIVPDDPVGPFGGVNPREVWLIAIVLAGVSFLGYGAVKYFGAKRGILLSAVAGGLVSSTAVTVTSARRAAAGEGAPRLLAAGVAVASAISFLRVFGIVAALQPGLLMLVGPPVFAAALAAAGFALSAMYWRSLGRAGGKREAVQFRNPFGFLQVIGFAVFLGIVILLGRAVGESYGTGGALIGAAAVGLADVDAITVSMARLASEPLGPVGASYAILAAVAANTLSKLAIGAGIGRGRFAIEITAMTALCWLAALIVLWPTMLLAAG